MTRRRLADSHRAESVGIGGAGRYRAATVWTPWHRSRLIETAGLAAVLSDLSRRPEVHHVVLDLDNTVVPYGSTDEVERRLIDETVSRIAAFDHVETISIVSNAGSGRTGPSLPVPSHTTVVWSADKPLTRRSRLAAGAGSAHTVVVGDLLMVDGVLAWSLTASYYHCPIASRDPYPVHRVLGWIGRVVRPLLFVTGDGNP